MLYTQEDFDLSKKQAIRSRLLIILFILAAFTAGLLPMLFGRMLVLSVVLSCLVAMLCTMLYGTLLSPVLSYRRFMLSAQNNINKTTQGRFESTGDDQNYEGVPCHVLYFVLVAGEEPRKFYLDCSLPDRILQIGQSYSITFTGNSILGIEPKE